MPSGMLLRSAWEETSLSAPNHAGGIDEWVSVTGARREEPIPLELFLRYSAWFAEQFVAQRDQSDVVSVEPAPHGYRLTTQAGSEVDASDLVVAVGVIPFVYVPASLSQLAIDPLTLASWDPDRMDRLAGKRLMVIGGGQSALEAAGLAAQAGAKVELVTRSRVHWFGDREPHYPRAPLRRRLYRLAYPAVGYGPPLLNRLVIHPDLFAALPDRVRRSLTRRLVRPGGSPWLRVLVDQSVRITEHCTVEQVERLPETVVVRLSDGSTREIDEILVACGYRFDLDRLSFLSPQIRLRIALSSGWPRLDRFFRSSDEHLFFVGYAAEARFGPLCRFVLGTEFTATRVAQILSH
jgi:hypothetical protein